MEAEECAPPLLGPMTKKSSLIGSPTGLPAFAAFRMVSLIAAGTLGQTRTADPQFRKLLLYPLSYKGMRLNVVFFTETCNREGLRPSEHPVELIEHQLDDDRSSMGTRIGNPRCEQIVDEGAHLFEA